MITNKYNIGDRVKVSVRHLDEFNNEKYLIEEATVESIHSYSMRPPEIGYMLKVNKRFGSFVESDIIELLEPADGK